jgi:hypothetical protein
MRSGLHSLDTDVGGLHHDDEGDNIEDGMIHTRNDGH